MNSADPSSNFVIRRGNGGGVGDDRNADDFYERFHRNQYYNAVEDEQIYVDEYTNMIHQYNDFITSGNAMFSRMEQTLRENLTRTLVRQSFYYNSVHNQRRDRVSLAPAAAPAAAPAPAPAPIPPHPIADTLPRLLSRYLNTEIARDARQPINNNANNNNIFSMLYTIPLEVRTNAANAGSGIGAGSGGSAATNDQIHRATMNTTFGNIISPVNATCPISRDEFNDESEITMIRGCNHIFNRMSLREWFVSHSTCPMCRGDIRLYQAPATPAPAATPAATPATPAAPLHRANMSIDSVDENHVTFSYDLPAHIADNQIYRDIVNTITGMTAAPATQPQPQQPSRRMDDNYYNYDDDDVMEVD